MKMVEDRLLLALLYSLCLEADVALDVHVRAVDIGSVDGHVDVRRPGGVAPLQVQGLVGLEIGGQRRVVRKAALVLDRNIPVAVDGRGDAVVAVELLRPGHLLVIGRGAQADVAVAIAVVDLDVPGVVFEVDAGTNGNAGVFIEVDTLGRFDGPDVESVPGRGR